MSITAEQFEQEIIDWAKSRLDDPESYDSYDDYGLDEGEMYLEYAIQLVDNSLWEKDATLSLASGSAKKVDEYGGEGKGEDYWLVLQINDQFFKFEGYYSSWDGGNWDSARAKEVKPVDVVVTQYQEV